MQARTDTPALSPRQERFCRYVSLGHSLAEAAKRAGYSPASARQRGSELYARRTIQDRVGVLAAEEAAVEERRFDGYRYLLTDLRAKASERRQYGVALRALTTEMRLTGAKPLRAERSIKDAEREADLRERIEAELRVSIEAELRERIEDEVRARLIAELRTEIEARRQAARQTGRTDEPGLSGTNHDHFAEPDVPAPAPEATGTRAEPVLSGTFHDVFGQPDSIGAPLVRRAAGIGSAVGERLAYASSSYAVPLPVAYPPQTIRQE